MEAGEAGLPAATRQGVAGTPPLPRGLSKRGRWQAPAAARRLREGEAACPQGRARAFLGRPSDPGQAPWGPEASAGQSPSRAGLERGNHRHLRDPDPCQVGHFPPPDLAGDREEPAQRVRKGVEEVRAGRGPGVGALRGPDPVLLLVHTLSWTPLVPLPHRARGPACWGRDRRAGRRREPCRGRGGRLAVTVTRPPARAARAARHCAGAPPPLSPPRGASALRQGAGWGQGPEARREEAGRALAS